MWIYEGSKRKEGEVRKVALPASLDIELAVETVFVAVVDVWFADGKAVVVKKDKTRKEVGGTSTKATMLGHSFPEASDVACAASHG